MDDFRPLSRRNVADERFDVPREGMPSYFRAPITAWLASFLWSYPPLGGRQYHNDWLNSLQLSLHLDPPLADGPGHSEDSSAAQDLLQRMSDDQELTLDVIDYALQSLPDTGPWADATAEELNTILRNGNSAWEAARSEGSQGKTWRLERRAVGPIRETIDSIAPGSSSAHRHLTAAWTKLVGRDPDPPGAYTDIVKAIEAAAKPVISPTDGDATLGKMIGAIRDKPEKWDTDLVTIDAVRAEMDTVWKGHRDRHGDDGEGATPPVGQGEAEAAFAVGMMLVQLFAGGQVRRATGG